MICWKMKQNYKIQHQKLSDKYDLIALRHAELVKESRSLVNYIMRIRKKCENERLYLIASHDPYKPLTTEDQQGPMVTRLFEMVTEMKKKLK